MRADAEDTRIASSDEPTQTWLPLPSPSTLDHAVDWCTRASHALRDSGDGIQFAIADPETDALLGAIGPHTTNWRALTTAVGCWGLSCGSGRISPRRQGACRARRRKRSPRGASATDDNAARVVP